MKISVKPLWSVDMDNPKEPEISDTQMLNWLDKQGAGYKWNIQLEDDYPHVKHCVFVKRNSMLGHETIREAISAKMKNT